MTKRTYFTKDELDAFLSKIKMPYEFMGIIAKNIKADKGNLANKWKSLVERMESLRDK